MTVLPAPTLASGVNVPVAPAVPSVTSSVPTTPTSDAEPKASDAAVRPL